MKTSTFAFWMLAATVIAACSYGCGHTRQSGDFRLVSLSHASDRVACVTSERAETLQVKASDQPSVSAVPAVAEKPTRPAVWSRAADAFLKRLPVSSPQWDNRMRLARCAGDIAVVAETCGYVGFLDFDGRAGDTVGWSLAHAVELADGKFPATFTDKDVTLLWLSHRYQHARNTAGQLEEIPAVIATVRARHPADDEVLLNAKTVEQECVLDPQAG